MSEKVFPDVRSYPDVWPALNVADVDVVTGAMGPSSRLAVWLQGCAKRCPGCINPAFLELRPARAATTGELLARLDAEPGLAGVSLSGGEPVLQAEALVPFVTAVRERGLSVVCYTGYDLDDLTGASAPRPLTAFLAQVDLLIAGPFDRTRPRAGPFCESANQRLHFFSDRVRPEDLAGQPAHEVVLGGDKGRWTGPLPPAIYRQLATGLEQLGVRLSAIARCD